jgi:crotonobetainyl-CoA:carnitine CoA-transferase CaiB-like acyl-CoA transferase
VLAAVIARATTGRGQHIDIAMSDASLALIATVVSRNPDLAQAPAKGMHRADSGIWRTLDGRYVVTTDMEPRYWALFCEAIGLPALASRQMDKAHWPQIKADIAAVMATKSQAEWLALFEAAGTQFAPVYDIAQALDDPHNRARGMVRDVAAPGGGTVRHIGSPIHLSETPGVEPVAGRPSGADTNRVLTALGYEEAHIAALMRDT